jgi:hypothetical protein
MRRIAQRSVCQTVYNVTLQGGALSEAEIDCVGKGYERSVDHCAYTDTSARVDWAVNWAVKQITESRAQPDKETRKARPPDESLRN